MTDKETICFTVTDLKDLLEIYGADQRRWPQDKRGSVCDLLERDGSAREIYGQAKALDAVLDQAPNYTVVNSASGLGALSDQITSAAAQDLKSRAAPADIWLASVSDGARTNVIDVPGATICNKSNKISTGNSGAAPQARLSPVDQGVASARVVTASTRNWRYPALLAASLLLGLSIGFSNSTAPVAQIVAQAAGMVSIADEDLAVLEFDDTDLLDEETL